MYSYEYDTTTGGLVLNAKPLIMSKEPRPVYYKELDILGFDKYWNYEKDDTYPYMWAEANNYFYRGRKVAQTKGGSCFTAPEIIILEEPEPNGEPLKFVDIPAMIEQNRSIMESLVQDTIKRIYNTYMKYRNKIDVFYVAFSGGKDSVVTLDVVQRTLPNNEFRVLFGDTGMEFADTYNVVEYIQDYCSKEGIEFIVAKSEYNPLDTWEKFGPPSKSTRWCCSVHKTSPQILTLRNITNKADFTGMAFIGVRASESASRNEYDYVSLGEKHKGQYSFNPILEWNSAELYIYMYTRNLYINDAYKKGNNRAGCLVCPNVSDKNAYFRNICYPEDVKKYMNIISRQYSDNITDEATMKDFLEHTGWKARMNGRDISIDLNYSESKENDNIILKICQPRTNWKIWIKTIGNLITEENPYTINFRDNMYSFNVIDVDDGYKVIINDELSKTSPTFVKLLKNVFRKSACCVGCHECEADCHNGCISMKNGVVEISDECHHCSQCHKVDKGCLIFKSLEMPKGGSKMEKKSLNCYSTHAPKIEWIHEYFEYKDEFSTNYTLGSQMYSFFKRFLRDAELLNEDKFSEFGTLVENLGLDNDASWALILANLAFNSPQINWLIRNVNINEVTSKEFITTALQNEGTNERASNDIFRSICRFTELPFNEVGIGFSEKVKNKAVSITRTSWKNPDPRVILYSLYRFAESCGDYYQFTLSRLYNYEIDSDGISPTRIFGIEQDHMEQILNGLSVNYPEFINASFTLNLNNITLRSDKTSADVLALFK